MNARRPRFAVVLCAAAALAVPASAAAADRPVRVTVKPLDGTLTARARVATVVVANRGRAPVRRLAVTVARARGVRVTVAGARGGRLTRSLGRLGAGRSVRVAVRVARTRNGPQSVSLPVTVTRAGKRIATARLIVKRAAATPTPPTPPSNPNTLEGRLFWGSRFALNGIQQFSLWFTSASLVFVDDPRGAVPTCSAPSDACKPYSYDGRTGALTIDGKPATLDGRTLEAESERYFEWGFPPAGARWDAVMTYSNSSGICPLYCSYFTEHLTFRPDGTFIRSSVASGSGPVVDWGVVPPDSKGSYEVRADRTLRLAFADGRERVETVALQLDDAGRLRPVTDGLLLNGDGYFDIRD